MKNGILYKYEEPIMVGEYAVRLIRKTPFDILIHTDKGVKMFNLTQESYTEAELHELLN
jgi:hypothetical protein